MKSLRQKISENHGQYIPHSPRSSRIGADPNLLTSFSFAGSRGQRHRRREETDPLRLSRVGSKSMKRQ